MKILILAAALSMAAVSSCHKIPDDSSPPHPEVKQALLPKPVAAPQPKPVIPVPPDSGAAHGPVPLPPNRGPGGGQF
ncbi:MAG: hypothetical protein K9N47_12075 [Prosthecobacter sp.]|uniref:hypothetical protein n=1 Tax=Prosthecobacter sp. TaxID=1965333 RepID=UPI0025D18295|nr:hypothetical protein [Prosthecobacter sp.]MCF7786854.1 hypothetical protein [Prosthecobacter sp.]